MKLLKYRPWVIILMLLHSYHLKTTYFKVGALIFSITTLCITIISLTTLSVIIKNVTLSILTLSITALDTVVLSVIDIDLLVPTSLE